MGKKYRHEQKNTLVCLPSLWKYPMKFPLHVQTHQNMKVFVQILIPRACEDEETCVVYQLNFFSHVSLFGLG